ncbi:MAG: hypothetical protein V1918_04870 [Planctomycetota bacterium]
MLSRPKECISFLSACLIVVLLVSGCARKKEDLFSSLAEQVETELENSIPSPDLLPPQTPAEVPGFFIAPDPVMRESLHPLSEAHQSDEKAVDIQIIEKRFNDDEVIITLLLRNVSENGVRKRLFAFGYDSNNRMIRSMDSAIYFQPREQIIEEYEFNRVLGITRWVFTIR